MFSASSPPSEGVESRVRKPDSYPIFIASFVALLTLSIHGVKWLPFYAYPGLDLQNLYAFHHQCPGWPVPYGVSGTACGDPLDRAMFYPPLAYWTMAWVRLFSFHFATLIWGFGIVGLTAFATWTASLSESRPRNWIWAVWFLVLFQMPMLYALERGNIDALVAPLFIGGAYFLAKRRGFLAGFLFATACWMKVYPVIPSAVALAAVLANPDLRKSLFPRLFLGFSVGGMAWAAILFPDSTRYVFEVLPGVSSAVGGFGTSSHTLYQGTAGIFVKIPALVFWTWFAARTIRRDPVFVMSGLLAISTFFQNLSNDYNLITAYPFLFIVLCRLLREGMTRLDFGMLVLTFLAFVGDRTPLELVFHNHAALFAQLVWFAAFPIYTMNRIDKGRWPDGNTSLR
jgi:hypothetical protein